MTVVMDSTEYHGSRIQEQAEDSRSSRRSADSERITINMEGKDEHTPRRMRITKKDLEKFGLTVGCAGCRAANRGSTAAGHTEEGRTKSWETW